MLTTAPGPDVEPFHDRQVIVLAAREWASWLYLDRPESEILKPLPPAALAVSLVRKGREDPPEALMAFAKTLSNQTAQSG